jgi:dCTP deaminase
MEEKPLGFLTGNELKGIVRDILGEEYDEEHKVEAVSCRLHLGEEVYVSGEDYPKYLSENDPYISLPRGQFALLLTRESISMPDDLFGLISIRMGKKEQGLINISGFHVDPGFKGKLIFSVFNAGPSDVVLRYGDDMFVMFLYRLHDKAPLENTSETHEGQKHLPVHIVTSLKGTSASLADVDRRIGQLETRERIYWAILVALITALVAIFIKGFS